MPALLSFVLSDVHNDVLAKLQSLVGKGVDGDFAVDVLVGVLPDTADVDILRSAFKEPVEGKVVDVVRESSPYGDFLVAKLGGDIRSIEEEVSEMLMFSMDDLPSLALVRTSDITDSELEVCRRELLGKKVLFDRMTLRDLDLDVEVVEFNLTPEDDQTDDE